MLFAFSSDEDVSVDAIHLLKELKCSVSAPTKICDSILQHFRHGIGSELHITEGFEELVKIAKRIQTKQDLGGNAA